MTSLGTPGMSEGLHANMSTCMEKVDEHYFLFRIEGRADPQHPALRGLRVEEDELGLLHRLKVPSVALRVADILSEALFRYTQKPKTLQDSPSHRILRHMHEVLNKDKKNN